MANCVLNFRNETDVSVRGEQTIRKVIEAWPNGVTAKWNCLQLATSWEFV